MQPMRVLVVDDEPKVALTLAASLEGLGAEFAVDTAYGFTEAFARAQQSRYSLLVVDYEMPGLNGLDLARAVRRVTPETRIVLMTAYGTQELRDTARLLGLVGYLDKPFTIAQLREIVQRSMGEASKVRRVLLMEGKDRLRNEYGTALRQAGYRVQETNSLAQATDLLARQRFSVFICALDIGGEAVLNMVRAQTDRLNETGTHVIAISSQGGHRSNWEELGVDFYLETPVATGPLVTLVDRLTARKRGVPALEQHVQRPS
jgi:DNA-binding NtrC family response regulator